MHRLELGLEKMIDTVAGNIPGIVTGFIILFLGRYAIRLLLKLIDRRFHARNVDLSLRGFLESIFQFVLYAMLIITAASTMGIQTTSFIAALSAMSLAIGLALQGSLANFAGGVLILIFRPFEVGDYISNAGNTEGTVEKIDLLYTTLRTSAGIAVFSPNGSLANSVIMNFTKITNRRFEYTIGIGYEANIKEAKETILEVLKADTRILPTPAPEVFVKELADSSVNLTVRAWTEKANYNAANTENQEYIKVALDKKGINIPYPQQELRIIHPEDSQLLD